MEEAVQHFFVEWNVKVNGGGGRGAGGSRGGGSDAGGLGAGESRGGSRDRTVQIRLAAAATPGSRVDFTFEGSRYAAVRTLYFELGERAVVFTTCLR